MKEKAERFSVILISSSFLMLEIKNQRENLHCKRAERFVGINIF
jgi:hypothetical protein